MSAIAALVLADAETVPVNHTFGPDKIDSNNVAFYENRVSGIVKKYETLSISNQKSKVAGGVRKVRVRIDLPYFDTVDTMLKLGSVGADLTFLLPDTSTLQQRKNCRVMLANLIGSGANNGLQAAVDTGESVY